MGADSQQNDASEPAEEPAATAAAPGETDRTQRIIEVLSALVLALAAVGAAWASYESARWGGTRATDTAEANTARLQASRAAATGGQLTQIDIGSFFQTVNAFAADDQRLFNFYAERLRAEFKPVFDEWLALEPRTNPNAPLSPFALKSYAVAELEEAEQLNEVAAEETNSAAEAGNTANDYTISVVLLAAALFFAGISTKFSSHRARIMLLAAGGVAFLVVVTWIAILPKSVAL